MLAQNFKTPTDLKITDAEFDGLYKVLGMLEREELHGIDSGQVGNVFCMSSTYATDHSRGTIGCIGGYAALAMGLEQKSSVQRYIYQYEHFGSLSVLYFPRDPKTGRLLSGLRKVTPPQAAIAVRNFLTHGEPRWDEALAG